MDFFFSRFQILRVHGEIAGDPFPQQLRRSLLGPTDLLSVGCFSKLRQRIKLQAPIPIKTIFMFPLLSWKAVINLLCRASASLFSPSANKIKAIHEIR